YVRGLETTELGSARLEQIGDLVEEAGTFTGGRAGPRALVGGARGSDGGVDVRLVTLGDDRDHGAVVRADALETFAGPAVDELAVDEQLIPARAVLGAEGLSGACHRQASFRAPYLVGPAPGVNPVAWAPRRGRGRGLRRRER